MERKNYLGLGIILAVVASVISLMFVVFSYADINENAELQDNQNSDVNDTLVITIDTSASTTSNFSINCSTSGYGWNWSPNAYTLSNYSPGNVMRMSGTEADVLKFGDSHGGPPATATITVTYDPEKVIFDGFTGGVEPGQSITSNTTFIATFKSKEPPVEPKSASIKGSAMLLDESTGASGAEVKFGNKNTGEVYGSAKAGSDGSFSINDINIDVINKMRSGEIVAFVYGSYPGYNIRTSNAGEWSVTQEGDVLVFNGAKLNLGKAIVNVSGAEHHKDFILSLSRTSLNNQSNATDTTMFSLSAYGMSANEFPSSGDVDFVISKEGSISASYQLQSSFQIDITSVNLCDDGYEFDYLEFNGEKHYGGETVKITPSLLKEPINAQVHYKPINEVNEIAKTGDAIPYAAVVGLGLVAIVAFVIARKQYNK